jgi:hypothetical protein
MTGKVNFTVNYVPQSAGECVITAEATDTKGQKTQLELGIITVKLDMPPRVIACTLPAYSETGTTFTISVQAADDRGIAGVTVTFSGVPDPVVLTLNDGVWTGTAVLSTPGPISYVVTVTDSKGQQVTASGTITVVIPYVPPVTTPSCFTGDTLILMADGNTKPISEIAIGDVIQGYDFSTGKTINNQVVQIYFRQVGSFLLINGNLRVTGEHPFAVGQGKWKKAGELEVGETVLGLDGEIKIASIEAVFEAVEVFNLTVNGTRNYYVTPPKKTSCWCTTREVDQDRIYYFYLVHNKSGGDSGGTL